MTTAYQEYLREKAKTKQKKALAVFLALFALIFLASYNTCFGYVTPDWDKIARDNKRQEVKTKNTIVDYAKQKKNNKKQKVKNHKSKVNKAAQKKRNKRQEADYKQSWYDLEAEIARNKLQEVKQ